MGARRAANMGSPLMEMTSRDMSPDGSTSGRTLLSLSDVALHDGEPSPGRSMGGARGGGGPMDRLLSAVRSPLRLFNRRHTGHVPYDAFDESPCTSLHCTHLAE